MKIIRLLDFQFSFLCGNGDLECLGVRGEGLGEAGGGDDDRLRLDDLHQQRQFVNDYSCFN